MPRPTITHTGKFNDVSPDFVNAVSLLAALEGATGQPGHAEALPFLGMARAELTHFGQRRPSCYTLMQVDDFRAGLNDLAQRLTALLADSCVLQGNLRIRSARRLLRRGIAAGA